MSQRSTAARPKWLPRNGPRLSDYVDDPGQVFSGQIEIEAKYKKFFAANKGLRIKIVVDALRLLSDTAAIEDGRGILDVH